jgi:methyl-accepting chemotaxis protein
MSGVSKFKIYNRRVLVDAFQLRLVGVGIFHFFLVVMVFVAALFTPIVLRLEGGDMSSPEVQAAAREFLFLHTRLWAPLLGAFVLLVLHNILVSHRVAGPLYRLRRFLKNIGDGDLLSPMKIRGNDYLHKEADAINDMLTCLRDKVSRLELQLDRANKEWMNLRVYAADTVSEEFERRITALGEHLEECRTAVRAFRTGDTHAGSARDRDEAPVEPVELEV